MILLKGVRLINWHYIKNSFVPFEQINFLTGPTGSGKSTLLDAIQIILYGETGGKGFFNKAASQTTSRDLKSYVRGEYAQTDNREAVYLRNGNFSSYIAITFENENTEKSFTLGVVFDVLETIEHSFFYFDSILDKNSFIKMNGDNSIAMSKKELKAYFESQTGLNYQFFESNSKYKEFFKSVCGGLSEKFFDLFKKAISFQEFKNVPQFINDFVVDSNIDINLESLQDNIYQYKKLQRESNDIKERVNQLEKIEEAYEVFARNKEDFEITKYMIDKVQLELAKKTYEDNKKTLGFYKERNPQIDSEIDANNLALKELEEQKYEIMRARDDSDVTKLTEGLLKQQRELKKEIDELSLRIGKATTSLELYVNEATLLTQKVCQLYRDIDFSYLDNKQKESFGKLNEASKVALAHSGKLSSLIAKEEMIDAEGLKAWDEALNAFISLCNAFRVSIASQIAEIEKNATELKGQKENLSRGKKPYSYQYLMVKSEIEKRLKEKFNKTISVYFFADLIDVRNKTWSNAIEGFLNTNRFMLFVDPDYYVIAAKIANQVFREMQEYTLRLLDQKKTIERGFAAKNGSLADEIVTDHAGARAFANRILGNLFKCKTIEEAINLGSGITPECDIYYNDASYVLSPRTYREHFIGRTISKELIDSKNKEYEDNSLLVSVFAALHEVLDDTANFVRPSKNEIELLNEDFKHIIDRGAKENNLSSVNAQLRNFDTGATDVFTTRLQNVEVDIANITANNQALLEEKGSNKTSIDLLEKEKLPNLENDIRGRIEKMNQEFDAFFLEETALPKFNEEIALGKSLIDIQSEYHRTYMQANYMQQQNFSTLIRLRKGFTDRYRLSYDTGSIKNTEFSNLFYELRDVKLKEYEAAIVDAYNKATKQFKDDFIAKLRSAISRVEDQLESLNATLTDSYFNEDMYQFLYEPAPMYRQYYDMIMDPILLETAEDDSIFIEKYRDTMEVLFRQIIDTDGEARTDQLTENVKKYTDYRTYLMLDIKIIKHATGNTQFLSKVWNTISGGQRQTPFYV
ncbi:MAG: hypothetical protein LBR37_02875, partial [Erysipelotrichaceae bacterium]|nr:hypothetical protein [Erysipelotrichaceae bacterium]